MRGQLGVGVTPAQLPRGWARQQLGGTPEGVASAPWCAVLDEGQQGQSQGLCGGKAQTEPLGGHWHPQTGALVATEVPQAKHPETAKEELPPSPSRFSLYFRAVHLS